MCVCNCYFLSPFSFAIGFKFTLTFEIQIQAFHDSRKHKGKRRKKSNFEATFLYMLKGGKQLIHEA